MFLTNSRDHEVHPIRKNTKLSFTFYSDSEHTFRIDSPGFLIGNEAVPVTRNAVVNDSTTLSVKYERNIKGLNNNLVRSSALLTGPNEALSSHHSLEIQTQNYMAVRTEEL